MRLRLSDAYANLPLVQWWSGVMANAVGTVIGVLLLGLLAEIARAYAPWVEARAEALQPWRPVLLPLVLLDLGGTLAFGASVLTNPDSGPVPRVAALVFAVMAGLGLLYVNARLVARLMRRVDRNQ